MGEAMKGIKMKCTVEAIRAHGDKDFQWRFIVQVGSVKHVDYGRVYSYVLDDNGSVRVFDTKAEAWACAAAI